jgi:hypothetical protein
MVSVSAVAVVRPSNSVLVGVVPALCHTLKTTVLRLARVSGAVTFTVTSYGLEFIGDSAVGVKITESTTGGVPTTNEPLTEPELAAKAGTAGRMTTIRRMATRIRTSFLTIYFLLLINFYLELIYQ